MPKLNLYFLTITSLTAFTISRAYDIFQGLAQQVEPCFDTIQNSKCNTSIPEVFTPPDKGAAIHSPTTSMYLFTTKNPDVGEPIHKCGGKLPDDSTFDPEQDTIFIIHGYADGLCRTAWMREMKMQLFKRSDYNIILVDWTWGNSFDAVAAGYNARVVGEQVGFVIKNIMRKKKIKGEKVHIIGHSFGSIAGSFAGKFVQQWKAKNTIRRLTVLDPPVIPYRGHGKDENIHYTDAKFVDVIHTNAGECFPISIGNYEVLGDVDFWPNGGKIQPACTTYIEPTVIKGDLFYALGSLYPPLCAHLQAIQFFKVSINHPNGRYIGARCNSYEEFLSGACKRCCKEEGSDCAVAGMDAEDFFQKHKKEPREERNYYFQTNNVCPFEEQYDFSIYKDCKDE